MELQQTDGAIYYLPVAIPIETRIANARINLARGLPRFVDRPELHLGRLGSAALVSGGPSAAEQIDNIRAHGTIIACGSASDWLIGNGICPRYTVIFDSGADHARFYRQRPQAVTFLVSSTCDPSVFDTLQGSDVHLWNPWDDIEHEVFNYEPRVNGGSTVSLRAIALAHIMGLRDLHFYGMDCSFAQGVEHAYPYEQDRPEALMVNYEGRQFMTTPQLLQQAHEFMAMCFDHQTDLAVKIHGDGLMGAMYRQNQGALNA